jgi:hypothetical protein
MVVFSGAVVTVVVLQAFNMPLFLHMRVTISSSRGTVTVPCGLSKQLQQLDAGWYIQPRAYKYTKG